MGRNSSKFCQRSPRTKRWRMILSYRVNRKILHFLRGARDSLSITSCSFPFDWQHDSTCNLMLETMSTFQLCAKALSSFLRLMNMIETLVKIREFNQVQLNDEGKPFSRVPFKCFNLT